MKTPEELAKEYCDMIGVSWSCNFTTDTMVDLKGNPITPARAFLTGYAVGHSAGYDEGADALADYLEKIK